MPPEDNTDENQPQDPWKGTKFEGKTPQQILEMHQNLEETLGRQGSELGELRGAVSVLQSERQPRSAEREPAKVSDYRRFAEDLIVEPERVLPEFGDEIERRAVEKATQMVSKQVTSQNQIEAFFRANPDLEPHRDIVSVIGEKLYAQYPNASLPQVLEATKREATTYITNLEKRFAGNKKTYADRTRAAVTTSGGMTREAVKEDESEDRGTVMSTEQQNIMDEIKRIKEGRAKKMLPPRHR